MKKYQIKSGKTKLFIFVLLSGIIIPNILFAQFIQQGPKVVGTGSVGTTVNQGSSVAISSDGNTAIVGGPEDNNNIGAVWIFTRSDGIWTQQGPKLIGSGSIGNAIYQGGSVAISSDGNTIIEGGERDNNWLGAIWVFIRSGNVWNQQGPKLVGTGSNAQPHQGVSVSISADGNTAVEGGIYDQNGMGAIWVFTRSGGLWTQQGQKLIGSGGIGSSMLGSSIAISANGNTITSGGSQDFYFTGAVWVFTLNGGVWTQQGPKLVGSGAYNNDASQGSSVSTSSNGNTIVEGGYADSTNRGAVWVFTRNSGVWTQQGPKLIGTGWIGQSYQGGSVAISSDGNAFVEGGLNDQNGIGAIWVFTRSNAIWTQLGSKFVGTGAVGNAFQGASVAISSEGTIIDGGSTDNSNIGAAWVFVNPTVGITPNSGEAPKTFSLSQNYPNPFNPSTKISFDLPKAGNVRLIVYDILGHEAAGIINNEFRQAGNYAVDFNASNLASGIYFYRLETEGFTESKKMILVK